MYSHVPLSRTLVAQTPQRMNPHLLPEQKGNLLGCVGWRKRSGSLTATHRDVKPILLSLVLFHLSCHPPHFQFSGAFNSWVFQKSEAQITLLCLGFPFFQVLSGTKNYSYFSHYLPFYFPSSKRISCLLTSLFQFFVGFSDKQLGWPITFICPVQNEDKTVVTVWMDAHTEARKVRYPTKF